MKKPAEKTAAWKYFAERNDRRKKAHPGGQVFLNARDFSSRVKKVTAECQRLNNDNEFEKSLGKGIKQVTRKR